MSGKQMQGLPVVTLRDMVVYPHGVQPLFIGTPKSIRALESEEAEQNDGKKKILLLAKKDPSNENPAEDELYDVGTVATVLQLIRLPDQTVKILVEGDARARVLNFIDGEDHF